jgi:hypothetical protein
LAHGFWLCTTAISPTRGSQRLKAFVSIFSFSLGQFRFGPYLLCEGSNIALHSALAHFHDLDLGSLSPTDGLEVVTRGPFLNAWLADVVILKFAGGSLCFGEEEAGSNDSCMSWSPTASAWIRLVGLKGVCRWWGGDALYKYLILFRHASQLQAV